MHPLYEQADSLTQEVIDAAVKVQKHFGIGALESIYVRCLERELELSGHRTSREKGVSITSRDMTFNENLRYDLLVDDCLPYVKLSDKPLGLVINFGDQPIPTRGIKRVILKGADEESSPF